MISALEEYKIDIFVNYLKSSFVEIPYTIFPKEDNYHYIFYLLKNLVGAEIQVEVITDKSRIDQKGNRMNSFPFMFNMDGFFVFIKLYKPLYSFLLIK